MTLKRIGLQMPAYKANSPPPFLPPSPNPQTIQLIVHLDTDVCIHTLNTLFNIVEAPFKQLLNFDVDDGVQMDH